MEQVGSPEKPMVQRVFRSPHLVGLGIAGAIIAAFAAAGVTSLTLAIVILILLVWIFPTVELWYYGIKKTERYAPSILLATTCLLGVGNVYLAELIYEMMPKTPPMESTSRFAVMLPFDTAPKAFPVPVDENPDDPMFRTYQDIHALAVNGTIPADVRESAESIGSVQWSSTTIPLTEAPTFLGKLMQYYIFTSIDKLQRNTMTVSVGYPAEADAGIEPPNSVQYPNDKLFRELSDNRFFQPFLHRESEDHNGWKLKPVMMPKETEITFAEESKSGQQILRLERPQHFKIDFIVENFSGTGPGNLPKHFVTANAKTTMQWAFFITMRYTIQRRVESDFHPEVYAQWADALYAGLKKKLTQN